MANLKNIECSNDFRTIKNLLRVNYDFITERYQASSPSYEITFG